MRRDTRWEEAATTRRFRVVVQRLWLVLSVASYTVIAGE